MRGAQARLADSATPASASEQHGELVDLPGVQCGGGYGAHEPDLPPAKAPSAGVPMRHRGRLVGRWQESAGGATT
jgi:hypothetical protein